MMVVISSLALGAVGGVIGWLITGDFVGVVIGAFVAASIWILPLINAYARRDE